MGDGNGGEDGFLEIDHVTFPLYYDSLERISTEACKSACSGNCSCTAYAHDGSGSGKCLLWHGDLLNLKQRDPDGKTINIKLAAYELQNSREINKTLTIALASAVPLVGLVLSTYIFCRWKKKQKGKMGPTQDILLFDVDMSIAAGTDETSQKGIGNEKNAEDARSPLFSFSSVTAATENFSNSNKLGEGGFGPVYKGKLLNGKHVAVKRLSKKSAQGMLELRNETMLIAKLQHKNLVRLLGCCLERDEKILIYEYMPNKSLDSILFDQAKRHLLNWEKRAHIVEGIAQGLIYLHQHSRLRIVHRDLKASNILLDSEMNPKIADFGLAKMFGGNESEANTNRIVGTYGYMSPEYALEGVISVKSDVFSFGVLLLEIISGKKNTGFYQTDSMDLLGHAWQLWQEDRALCLVDSVLEHHNSDGTLMRHINVALLCVQEIAADRPTMSEVLTMLTNELLTLPSPKQPAFSHIRTQKIPEPPLYRPDLDSVNDVTVSLMEARYLCTSPSYHVSLPLELLPEENSTLFLRQFREPLSAQTSTSSMDSPCNTNMPTMKLALLFLLMFSCHCIRFSVVVAAATSTISVGQSLTGSDTLVSSGGVFELGFFSPGNSSDTYLGIWYKKIEERTVVWVGNRDQPLTISAPALAIDGANLVIQGGRTTYHLSNNSVSGNVSATLLDSGNFVLRGESSEAILWQSFDDPSDTFLPGMKLGYSRETKKVWALTSWKNAMDPSPGDFSLRLDSESLDEFVILKGSEKYWASGPWNRDSQTFSLVPEMRLNYIFNYSFINNPNEVYFTYSIYSSSNVSTGLVIDLSGQIKQRIWLESSKAWNLFWSQPRDPCDVYKFCGSFSRCSDNTFSSCACLDGFRPSDQEKWQQDDTSGGCVRKKLLQCEQMGYENGGDGFLKMNHVTFPLYYNASEKLSSKACKSACSGDCSCTAYAYNGSGTGRCLLWYEDLLNLRQLSEDDPNSNTIYIKLAASELQNSRGINKTLKIALASAFPLVALFLTTYMGCQWKKKRKGKMGPTQDILLFDVDKSIAARTNETSEKGIGNEKITKDAWLPLFSFSSVNAATQNFSNSNKLGEGGFGPVYKGKLLSGKRVAVKRLSKKSAQGMLELRNETMLVAKLQHKNLVRLLGCCLERDEKILIYEYMSNKSLDSFLFDQAKRHLLNWETRAHIVEGIAQGLIYLHQHSRLRIVHRDLKASNILLDSDMNPKISDFGLAKMFGGNESEANTNRIVGTYGYMSPEYALEGVVSTKSDVFSFGVLLLEIISGKKNTGFYQTDSMNLLGYAWQLWQEDGALCLVDSALENHNSDGTLMRHINVALLCVQEIAADRPTMSEVLTMLTNELLILSSPKQPAFSYIRTQKIPEPPLYRPDLDSINDVTVSVMEAR
ncbi:receptor-like serine/threonine-protein kinase SD1-7 [Eucalyptus grandis]|uniref:receptor-like serine/threonine-protein kinase SD1-7 n=1 Tax=Eucalyptus grandis TaxID=71139 RepID=UPI00192EB083|nr:receptor-like serine/threonine-protein kinase SD1-7 [Eucalyptus grandis]